MKTLIYSLGNYIGDTMLSVCEGYLWCIVLLPLLGSIISGFSSFLIGWKGSALVTIFLMLVSNLLSYLTYYFIILK